MTVITIDDHNFENHHSFDNFEEMVGLTWASVSKARSSISISQRFELSSGSTPIISIFEVDQHAMIDIGYGY